MTQTDALLSVAHRHIYPNYTRPDVVLVRGEGSRVWDSEGRSYVDLYAGVAVNILGHAHPAHARAIREQAEKLIHTANYYFTDTNIRLAETLTRLSGYDRVLFCNSGAEANEALLKLARRYFYNQGQPERSRVIAFENSFHGRTLGALAATGQPKYQLGFGPMGGVTHVPYGDLTKVRQAFGPDVAAILVEPVLGEGGVIPAAPEFLRGLRALADEHGALLLADEIQTGVGRTGKFLGFDHAGVKPDAISLAKGLGGGFPIGAMVCKEFLKDTLTPGTHGTTYGGNPLASAASLAILEVLERENLIERTAELGAWLAQRLNDLVHKYPLVLQEQRGLGLLQGLVLRDGATLPSLVVKLRDAGLLVITAGTSTLRLCPALTVSEAELEEGLQILDRVLGESS